MRCAQNGSTGDRTRARGPLFLGRNLQFDWQARRVCWTCCPKALRDGGENQVSCGLSILRRGISRRRGRGGRFARNFITKQWRPIAFEDPPPSPPPPHSYASAKDEISGCAIFSQEIRSLFDGRNPDEFADCGPFVYSGHGGNIREIETSHEKASRWEMSIGGR